MEKMTYVKALEFAINNLSDEAVTEKLEALKASIAKKNAGKKNDKPTAKQVANNEICNDIYMAMEVGKPYTISEMIKTFDFLTDFSNQRVSSLVGKLVDEMVVDRTVEKRRAYFTRVGE